MKTLKTSRSKLQPSKDTKKKSQHYYDDKSDNGSEGSI